MTSLEFFRYPPKDPKILNDWGTDEPKNIKLDPTSIRGPTFNTKSQPIEQLYRVCDLQLSNVRAHDQVEPKSYELNMNDYQVSRPFPMEHPQTSHISRNLVFPDYSAPEDPRTGEMAIKSKTEIKAAETKSHPDPVLVVSKSFGHPWRHEVQYLPLPSQKQGAWWVDQALYQYPKPDYNKQLFYPAPTTILAPNPKARNISASLDPASWNILKNKERDLMQSMHQIDFYKDGLGTRVPLNSDDLEEKNAQFLKTGQYDTKMKPYFKRGTDINNPSLPVFQIEHVNPYSTNNEQPPLTQLEKDEVAMEKGRNYNNYPEARYTDVQNTNGLKNLGLLRSKTISVIEKSSSKTPKQKGEKQKREEYFHDQVQQMETRNRLQNIQAVTPGSDITTLKFKYASLENARDGRRFLKQNVSDHVNTLYNHESKYLGERADIYPTSYNPYKLENAIDSVKAEQYALSVDIYSQKQDVVIPNDSYEHRPKLFADRVFSEHFSQKRKPLENSLRYPIASADAKTQENGFILKQTCYGDSYNTKKLLQENEPNPDRLSDPSYVSLGAAELELQDVALKSKAEEIALKDYKAGLTKDPKDVARAAETIETFDKYNKTVQQTTYPRMAGPLAPEPYEQVYCADKIIEMTDGYNKRQTERLYDSPFQDKKPQFQPLNSDLQTLAEIEKANKEAQQNETNATPTQDNEANVIHTTKDIKSNFTARYDENPLRENFKISNYEKDYRAYHYELKQKCPPNTYYDNIKYTESNPLPNANQTSRLVSLQDKWSKTEAQKKFLLKYATPSSDLRDNMRLAKKPVFISPTVAPKYFGKS